MKRIKLILLLLIFFNTTVFSQDDGFYEDIMTLSNVLNHVRANYFEEIKSSYLMNAAINGLLSSLDPHTIYLDSKQYRKFLSISTGKAFGIGFFFEIIDGFPTVISIIPGGPAAESPIHAGDILLKVDNKSAIKISEPDLMILLSGEKGSKVKLTLQDYLTGKEYNVILKRDEIPIRSINYYYILGQNTGYIKINHFSKTTSEELQTVLDGLSKRNMKSLVLDLRGNPGGILQSAIQVADLFLPGGNVIMTTNGRKKDANQVYYSTDDDTQPFYPMIVLVDRGSASASEIVAGALQEHDRAFIIGTNSFGKGLVQGTFLLNDGGAILMTIARYFTPIGRLIQREYKEKTFDEYYNEIYKTDALNYKERPKLKTKGGRVIYGGGGIIPDIFIESESIPFRNWNEIEESNIIYKYAGEYVKNNSAKLDEFKNLSDYVINFSLDDKVKDDIIEKILNEGFDVVTSNDKFGDYLLKILKQEIARIRWDLKAAHYVSLHEDLQLKKALESIPMVKETLRFEE